MKNILLLVLVSMFGLVGCSSSIDGNNINLISSQKAEVVVKSEYVSRLTRLCESTIYLSYDEEKEQYISKYYESKVLQEKHYGGDRDIYKDLTEGLSAFRTKDDDINKLHYKLIEVSLDIYNLYKEYIDLGYELNGMYERLMDRKVKDFTDEEHEICEEIDERLDIIETMIENQEDTLKIY